MSLTLRSATPPRRSGVVLLVVVILLALFAVVGLAFVFYSESEATASRIYREAQSVSDKNVADVDAKTLLNYALGQLVYDCKDDGPDLYSAMRGHSLTRGAYGWNYRYVAGTYTPGQTNFENAANSNTTAFNGIGALHTNTYTAAAISQLSDYQLPNYTYHKDDGFIRDPERVGARSGPNPQTISPAVNPYAGGFNVPYTFPDRNNMFLAAVQAAYSPGPGQPPRPRVLMPSFVRPGVGTFGSLDRTNTSWGQPNAPGKPALKYTVMRPRPGDHLGFQPPADRGGDVKNLPPGCEGYNGGYNDSYWIDLGYPVQITNNGRKYKPLFAFLITDLDNRLNVNVHGNARGQGDMHVSNQGLAAHEANLLKVLNSAVPPNPQALREYQQLLGVSTPPPSQPGRYGLDNTPPPPPGSKPIPGDRGPAFNIYSDVRRGTSFLRPFLAPLDYDGVDQTSGQPTSRFQLPNSFAAFPNFQTGSSGSSTGYENLETMGSPIDPRQANPLLYNVLRAANRGDRAPLSATDNLYYLLSAPGGLYNRSTLATYLPSTLGSLSIRNLITTHSFDLDTPGVIPFYGDVTQAGTGYERKANMLYPTGGGQPIGGPPTATPLPTPAMLGSTPNSEFLTNDGRAKVLGRLDLRRKLTSFGAIGGPDFNTALQERQQFAKDVFERLVQATGANPNAPPSPSGGPPNDQYEALRFLAQLAANIVDYVDDDDLMTPFNGWGDQSKHVYGTELPKLVINEVYAEIRNNMADTMPPATQPFQLNFWVELLNPLTTPAGQNDPITNQDRATASLQSGGVNNYRIKIVDEGIFPPSQLREIDHSGDPASGLIAQVTAFDAGGGPDHVLPGNGGASSPQGQNQGFYVLAPASDDIEGAPGAIQPTRKDTNLTSTIPVAGTVPTKKYTIVLQRLAIPGMAESPTNPFVTVDYLSGVQAQDAVKNTTDLMNPNPNYRAPNERWSIGRAQPYAAAVTGAPQTPAAGNPIKATLFSHNETTPNQFDWLVHLDRPPISVPEMIHVPGYKPHELTQQFMIPQQPAGGPPMAGSPPQMPQIQRRFLHAAPFAAVTPTGATPQVGYTREEVTVGRLFRALEYFTVADRTFGAFGGRKPGMVNINTVWDQVTLEALADAQATPTTNFFGQQDVANVWNALVSRRGGSLYTGTGVPGTHNYPFWGAAPVQPPNGDPQYPNPQYATTTTPINYPGGVGVQNTLYAGDLMPQLTQPTNPGASGQPYSHPYAQAEMLTKIGNTITTRSNVFAVYLTVGFFEVMNDTTLPVKLGDEIRKRDGTPTRHKFFAIVDRTNLALDWPTGATDTTYFLRQSRVRPVVLTAEGGVVPTGSNVTVNVAASNDYPPVVMPQYDGSAMEFQPGASPATVRLVIDVGYNQEILEGQINWGATPPTITAQFQKPHAPGFLISNVPLGNPGPQGAINVDDSRFKNVIPAYKIIQ